MIETCFTVKPELLVLSMDVDNIFFMTNNSVYGCRLYSKRVGAGCRGCINYGSNTSGISTM